MNITDLLRIPNDDADFEEEPEDELASAGFRVVDGDAEEEPEEGLEDADGEVLAEVLGADDEAAEDEADAPADGLEELDEMEKNLEEIPLNYDTYED